MKQITFILAWASLMYEFCLSQVMSIIFGSITTQYIITTGLFIFFLGIGALVYEYKIKDSKIIKIYHIEFCICFFGALSSILPFVFLDIFGHQLAKILSWLLIALIATLSGVELPALMHLSKNKIQTLGWDYLGMCFAGLSFTFIFLPYFGVVATSFIVASVNFLIALILMRRFNVLKFKLLIPMTTPFILLFFFNGKIENYLEGVFIGLN